MTLYQKVVQEQHLFYDTVKELTGEQPSGSSSGEDLPCVEQQWPVVVSVDQAA